MAGTDRKTKRRRNGSHPRSVEGLLDLIDRFLSDTTIETTVRCRVWDVLTALRGPDQGEIVPKKWATTAIVRSVAFPRTSAETCISRLAMFADVDDARCVSDRTRLPDGAAHFSTHVTKAFQALGLEWDSPNDLIAPRHRYLDQINVKGRVGTHV